MALNVVYAVVMIHVVGWNSQGDDVDNINDNALNKLYIDKRIALIESINANTKKLHDGNPCNILDSSCTDVLNVLEEKNNALIFKLKLNQPAKKYMGSYTIVVETKVM